MPGCRWQPPMVSLGRRRRPGPCRCHFSKVLRHVSHDFSHPETPQPAASHTWKLPGPVLTNPDSQNKLELRYRAIIRPKLGPQLQGYRPMGHPRYIPGPMGYHTTTTWCSLEAPTARGFWSTTQRFLTRAPVRATPPFTPSQTTTSTPPTRNIYHAVADAECKLSGRVLKWITPCHDNVLVQLQCVLWLHAS